MKNATRNRLLFWLFIVVCMAISVAFAWVMGAMAQWRARSWPFAACVVGFWIWFFAGIRRDRGHLDVIERELRAAGGTVPDEKPIPIKLAQDRESLIASTIALVLIAAVFVAYYTGWLHRVGFL